MTYTVTSEDGQYKRTYTVEFSKQARMVSDILKFDFENYCIDRKYGAFYEWFELDEDGKEWPRSWANGNLGFGLSGGGTDPDQYPTTVEKNGYEGAALKLVTCSTGFFGAMAKKYIAAGSLFLGEFDLSVATTEPLKSTRFGVKFDRKPIKMTGYYQYKPAVLSRMPRTMTLQAALIRATSMLSSIAMKTRMARKLFSTVMTCSPIGTLWQRRGWRICSL